MREPELPKDVGGRAAAFPPWKFPWLCLFRLAQPGAGRTAFLLSPVWGDANKRNDSTLGTSLITSGHERHGKPSRLVLSSRTISRSKYVICPTLGMKAHNLHKCGILVN